MIVAVTGASGLVGSALVASLAAGDHRAVALVRRTPRPGENALRWDPSSGVITPAGPAVADAIVHLAGDSIMGLRWTMEKKRRIRESRTTATRLLVQTLIRLPRALRWSWSAPRRSDTTAAAATRYSPKRAARAPDSAAIIARAWEAATAPAIARGIRVVNLRLGVVLSARGGALAKMLTPFRLGLGGVIGDGASVDELDRSRRHDRRDCPRAHDRQPPRTAVNAVAPAPATNAESTRTLGRALGRSDPCAPARVCGAPGAGRDGRRALAGESARRARAASGHAATRSATRPWRGVSGAALARGPGRLSGR